jgi:aminoglycoside phosphotransferase (APT) family kinase protein
VKGRASLPTDSLVIPRELDDVTPAWLTRALSGHFPGADVASVVGESLHQGTASTLRLHVEYASNSAPAPRTMCLKAAFGLTHAEHLEAAGLYRKEAMAYRDVLPRTTARVATSFAAEYDNAGRAFVLMEDLAAAGARFCGPDKPLTVAQVGTAVEQLAQLHAASWNDPSLHEIQWTHHGRSLSEEDPFWAFQLESFDDVLKTPHGGAMAHVFHHAELFADALSSLRRVDNQSANSLIHGDAHLGNFFVDRDGQPGMADFQCVQRGHFTLDLAMIIPSALDVLDRRSYEQDLLRGYVAAIDRYGVPGVKFDEVWLGYRRHLMYSLLAWVLTTEQFQSELHLVTNVFRYGLAALDLDSMGALQE